MNRTFSFITPAYNNPQEVKKLLDSIRPEFQKDPTIEVLVVDDCSKDDGLRKIAAESGFAKYIRLEKNSGPARARNVGAEAAKNDILIFVDSDVVLNEDTLQRIRDKFRDEKVGILGGEYDLEPANPSPAARFKALMVASWRPKENFVTVFLTRIGAIKKEIFAKFGGFDASLKTASVEDYEFGRRLMDAGHILYYDPAITVRHHFPPFRKQVKLFFHRAFMWVYTFRRCGKFDNTCTTPLQGISQLCGFLAIVSLSLSAVNIKLLFVSAAFLVIFVLTSSRFFLSTLEHEGLIFTLRAIIMALIISCSIALGALWGVIYYFAISRSGKRPKA